MAAIRRAEATWSGALTTGSGTVTAVSSGAFTDLPVLGGPDRGLRRQDQPRGAGRGRPAACFAMALSGAPRPAPARRPSASTSRPR